MIRTVGKGTKHGWSKIVGPVGTIVQEETCARSDAAKGFKGKMVGNENKKRRDKKWEGRCIRCGK